MSRTKYEYKKLKITLSSFITRVLCTHIEYLVPKTVTPV